MIEALKRLGFVEGHRTPGSHQTLSRVGSDGHKCTTVVVLGKKEIPTGTLRGLLKLGGVTGAEFRESLKGN